MKIWQEMHFNDYFNDCLFGLDLVSTITRAMYAFFYTQKVTGEGLFF